ncbi:hypothetical protein TorRG33x02_120560 [Trema orientale]|uniref:Uncharacterized protein n=1 Tax=Trema orientale TaxID=63057 RepID=A0A2P5F355_TREOI|nr:hypothetical protein TorRG33x02_120560 [Trema orientale]
MLSPDEKSKHGTSDADNCNSQPEGEEIERCANSRCATEKVSRLVSGFSELQKKAISECGFGVFLDLKNPSVKGNLIAYLINNIDPKEWKIKLNGKTFKLTFQTFEHVMSLGDGREHIILSDDDELNPLEKS